MGKKIIIIGAGLSGLSCAYHLENDYEIFDKENEAGGLCRSMQIDGFTFDFTGHLLHFKNQRIFKLVKELLKLNLKHHIRNSSVFLNRTYCPYPFQANTYSLPKEAVKECIRGLLNNAKGGSEPRNFYEWMMRKFGKGVVRHFMLPYNLKFWRIHPRFLAYDWVEDRIPLPNLKDSISGAFESSIKSWGYNSHFWYPDVGGISALPRAFEKKVKRINFNCEVKKINLKKKEITFDNSFTTQFDYLISTIPLTEMEKIIFPMPLNVRKAIRKLRYLSIFNLNLGICRNDSGGRHWIYFPDPKIIFYRIGFFNNFSTNLSPFGHTSLYVEVSYLKKNHINNDGLLERIYHDLVKVNIISRRNQIVCSCVNDIKYGYVIYDHNHRQAKRVVLEFLNKNKIFSIGRFGSWRYLSMEESMLDGKNAAEMLNRNNR